MLPDEAETETSRQRRPPPRAPAAVQSLPPLRQIDGNFVTKAERPYDDSQQEMQRDTN